MVPGSWSWTVSRELSKTINSAPMPPVCSLVVNHLSTKLLQVLYSYRSDAPKSSISPTKAEITGMLGVRLMTHGQICTNDD